MRTTVVTLLTAVLLTLAPAGVALAGGGGHCRQPLPQEATGDTVSMRLACFEPNILRTDVGTTVTFVNEEYLPHRVVGLGMGFGSLDVLEQGDEVTATFDTPGVYPYVCDLHPGMLGAVVVGDGVALGDTDLAAATGAAAKEAEIAPGETETAVASTGGVTAAGEGRTADAGESAMGLSRTLPAALLALALAGAAALMVRRPRLARRAGGPPQPGS